MQFLAITSLLALAATLASAAPAAEPRQFKAQLTFYGAAGASYTLSVPTDGSVFHIGMSYFPLPLLTLAPSPPASHPSLKNGLN